MRFRTPMLVALLLSLPPNAWSADSPAGSPDGPLPYARIQPQCAPWDGPGVGIHLSAREAQCGEEAFPSLHFGIFRDLPKSAPRQDAGAPEARKTYSIRPSSDAVSASYCPVLNGCKMIESGTLILDKYDESAGASGHYEFRLPDGRAIRGKFRATWCKSRGLCG